jgi:large subunit ribosomal protein L17
MRHRKMGRQFGRNTLQRKALFRNLVTSFIESERVVTTEAKAKEIRRLADRMVTLGKRGDLHARRLALAYLRKPSVVKHLFEKVAPRLQNRNGGYTRILKTGRRLGDAAPMVVLELVEREAAAPTRHGGEAAGAKGARPPQK